MSSQEHELLRPARVMSSQWRRRAPRAVAAAPAIRLRAWVILLFVAAYVFADPATGLFPNPRFGVQPLSPHPALALALMGFGGFSAAPPIFFAVLLGWALAADGSFTLVSVPAAFALTLVYWSAAAALRRWTAWGGAQVGPRDVNVFLAVCVPTALLCALVEALRQIAGPALGASVLPLLTLRLFIANLLGMAVLGPLLLQLASGAWVRQMQDAGAAALARDGVIFLLILMALLEIVFGLRPLDDFRMSYLLFLPVIVIAMRRGVFGVATFLPLVQAGLLVALMMIGTRPGTAFEFQVLMLTLAVATLYLGALSDERQRAAARIADHERALRERGAALAEAQRMASTAELAAALAHDLSQPLSAIGTYASASQVLAGRGPQAHPQLLDTLAQITQESARAGHYLRRMRDFFRTGAMREESVRVAELVETTHAHLRDRLLRDGIVWHCDIDAALPPVMVDAVQIGAVLGNLVGNACDALAGHAGPRRIDIRAFLVATGKPTLVRIQVEDSGPGIPADLRARLFLPLATTKPNGMGLGLALSRSITERQGGHLWFDDSRPATTFCLDLRTHA